MKEFVHLHLHSEFSTRDSVLPLKDIAPTVKSRGMNAVALTDHGYLGGVNKFYKSCKENEVKPIIGVEAYGSFYNEERAKHPDYGWNYHFLLLAKNTEGYKNLLKLEAESFDKGFYRENLIDEKMLAGRTEGLIATSTCLNSFMANCFRHNKLDEGEAWLQRMIEMFGRDNFFMEVQVNNIDDQRKYNDEFIVPMAKKYDIPLVLTFDVHQRDQEQWRLRGLVQCISFNKTESESTYPIMDYNAWILPTEKALELAYSWGLPDECVYNTAYVAEKVESNYFDEVSQVETIVYNSMGNEEAIEELTQKARIGLLRRLGVKTPKEVPAEYKDRLNEELQVIIDFNYYHYFLVVKDYVDFARKSNIVKGPGRGSAGGSLLAYSLGITDADPLKYDLSFERFLNKERNDFPDIDLDFESSRFSEMIDYLLEKYGEENVARISTYKPWALKESVRDFNKVFGGEVAEGFRISDQIPDAIRGNATTWKDLQKDYPGIIAKNKDIFEHAGQMDGLTKFSGQHACGFIIHQDPLVNHIPLKKLSTSEREKTNQNYFLTEWETSELESKGYIKFDLLSIKTADLIARSLKLAGLDPKHFDNATYDDPEVFDFICKGYNSGLFQIESSGMKELIGRIQPKSLEDLSDILALYRPGPMDSGLLDKYVDARKSKTNCKDFPPIMDKVLSPTYGVMVYQEQVMKACQLIAGLTGGEADLVRRAMGKKILEKMLEWKEKFIKGAAEVSNLSAAESSKLWDQIEAFAGYGFNKSHSIFYSMITYQTAWLKHYYPSEFFCALLQIRGQKKDEAKKYIAEARSMGVEIKPPDINLSSETFSLDNEKGIIFSFDGIYGVGNTAARAIKKIRSRNPFRSIEEFIERTQGTAVNKGTIEALVKAGCFDSLGYKREELYNSVEEINNYFQAYKVYETKYEEYLTRQEEIRQNDLERERWQAKVDAGLIQKITNEEGKKVYEVPRPIKVRAKKEPEKPKKPDLDSLKLGYKEKQSITLQMVTWEQETCSYFISAHPIDFINIPETVNYDRVDDINGLTASTGATIVVVSGVDIKTVKNGKNRGKQMAVCTVEDQTGSCEMLLFPGTFDLYKKISIGQVLYFKYKVLNQNENSVTIIPQGRIKFI